MPTWSKLSLPANRHMTCISFMPRYKSWSNNGKMLKHQCSLHAGLMCHLLNMCHVYRIKFWTSQCLLPCCHKLPHTNNQTSPHTINILNTHSTTGYCDSPWDLKNSTLWHCSHVFSWEMNIVTAKQDVSALQTFNMSKNTELIKWNNFL